MFQKNPNVSPGKWWGRGKFPKVAKPVLGESLNIEHLMPTHISRDTVVKFHDRSEFLEVRLQDFLFICFKKCKFLIQNVLGYNIYNLPKDIRI